MKIFNKIRHFDGLREIYFCGVKIFAYHKHIIVRNCYYEILKYLALQKHKDFENLILGSSHGRDGFIPGKNDFNLSNSSLDLYRIWNLYKYVVEHGLNKIKKVIIFWSVFHPGLQLEKTKEFKKCIPYKALFNIDYACGFKPYDKYAIKRIKKQLNKTNCPNDYRGKSGYDKNHIDPADILVSQHLKNTMRNNNQIQYLDNIVKLARKQKHAVYIVLPPYRSDYLKYLPDDKIIYRELFDFLNENTDVKLLNLQRDNDFTDSDFDSPDHCNENGGIKLTEKIRHKL